MTTIRDYPFFDKENLPAVAEQMRQICNIRKDDITQFQNLSSIFFSGRKVGRIPSASNDVISGDRLGDINYTATYFYILIDNSGTPEWRRISLGSW